MNELKKEQQQEERQEYGSLVAKQSKETLLKGLSLGALTPGQQTELAETCLILIEFGTALVHQEGAGQ